MEWVKIFSDETAARLHIAPQKPQLLILHGERICLALYDNKFYAVQDSCTHNGESLSTGKVNYLGEIVCPWHGYRFALQSGRACDSSCHDLKLYPVKTDESGFYIGLP